MDTTVPSDLAGQELTYGAVVPDDAVVNVTVGADAGVGADEDVLLHLAALAQADSGPSVDVVARIRAAPPLLVDEVRLGGERVDPPPHEVRRHRVVHEEVGHADAVTVLVEVVGEELGNLKENQRSLPPSLALRRSRLCAVTDLRGADADVTVQEVVSDFKLVASVVKDVLRRQIGGDGQSAIPKQPEQVQDVVKCAPPPTMGNCSLFSPWVFS
ncbi:hypothetical protein EYF80_036200 [Liparis tanakae]|uniref:Uncharacterized protein n=1 Tax=Liparis tanakae TaxID=230148 RepID=A0A4Z2GJI7_9TELE|nr:hypothetical protein EYF80_036200 [Liparis tanakae]